jgi:hypothetical protein
MENYYIPIEEKDPYSEIDCVKKIEEAVPTVPSWWLPA